MGVCYSAAVVAGVPWDNLFSASKKKVTKYNPDTGKPYTKEIRQWVLCGNEITGDEDPCCYPEEYLPEGLACFHTTPEGGGDKIIGVEVAMVGHFGIQALHSRKEQDARTLAEKLLKETGYDGEVRMYLVLLCSY